MRRALCKLPVRVVWQGSRIATPKPRVHVRRFRMKYHDRTLFAAHLPSLEFMAFSVRRIPLESNENKFSPEYWSRFCRGHIPRGTYCRGRQSAIEIPHFALKPAGAEARLSARRGSYPVTMLLCFVRY